MNKNEQPKINVFKVFFTALVVLLQVGLRQSFAQDDPCDPDILRLSGSDSLAYKKIETKNVEPRCEGTFANPSGGAADLQLVSLTQSFPLISFTDTQSLYLSWLAWLPADVHVRAVSGRYKYYYQMDAHPGARNTFVWPTNRLKESHLLRPEVGVLVRSTHTIAGKAQEVLFPVAVQTKSAQPVPSQPIEVVLVPTVQLTEVFRTITHFTDAGVKQAVLLNNKPLQYGIYQAHDRVVLALDLGNASGLFRFDVLATISDGGTIKKRYWIYVRKAH